jgi:predicted ATP-grasp superfamily ATP-dependent carboligase
VGFLRALSNADSITAPVSHADGQWHFAVATEDNAAADGVKRKLYVDGRLVGGSTVLNTITLAGANRFRVGALNDGTIPFTGQLDAAFVYAGALTPEQVRALYNVGSLALAASPKAEGDHVEALEATGLLAHFDAIEGTDLVDLSVVG